MCEAAEALVLQEARGVDALANRRGGLARGRRGDLLRRQRRHLHLQIDPVEQRAGDLREVARDLDRRAEALAACVVEVAAGALLRCLFVI